ncbi:MAG: RNA polymerase factor sigma-54 [Rhodocyclaceae bacterium]|nr:RNA polymerase factor sigma-54 [Rhodocyclaceae bacterium]
MKQTLNLRLSQHLALTPQLQQSIRLLQLSTIDLTQEIEQALQDNPMLERVESYAPSSLPSESSSPSSTSSSDASSPSSDPSPEPSEPIQENQESADWEVDFSSSAHQSRNANHTNDGDEVDVGEIQAAVTDLRDHLTSQLSMTRLNPRERQLVALLIEALNGDGYLAQTLDELANIIPDEPDVKEELSIALKHLQHFDPLGIGARTLQECLDLQLAEQPVSPIRDLARKVVQSHLDKLAVREFQKIIKALNCTEDALREAHLLICSLNPRPGAPFEPLDTRYVVPDVIVRKIRGHWRAIVNTEMLPKLRINSLYANILRKNRKQAAPELVGQFQEAKWLIQNIQQRFDTLALVTQAIVDRQSAFFDHGEVAMKPLTLNEIADTVNLHNSTISRVTTQKYLSSPRGIFELKYFFGSHVSTEAGGAASATAIRALIRQLVGTEEGHKPLSDVKIAEILGEQGFVVARRTVAKYRESMHIPPVNLRKTL